MKKMERLYKIGLLLLFFVLSTSFQIWGSQNASTSEADVQEQNKTIIINEIFHESYDLKALPSVEIIQNDSVSNIALDKLLQSLMTVNAKVLDSNEIIEDFPIKFLNYPSVDPSVPGSVILTVNIAPGDNTYEFSDTVPTQLTIPVEIITPEEPFVITRVDSIFENYYEAFAVPLGGDLKDYFSASYDALPCYEEDGTQHAGKIIWNTDNVDTNTAGVYEIIGSFEPPLHGVISDTLIIPEPIVKCIVQEPGKPEIEHFTLVAYGLRFPWILTREELRHIKPWFSENSGPWTELTKADGVNWNTGFFMISYKRLRKGNNYRFMVDYENGHTNILSFFYDETIKDLTYNYGDRDGGDSGSNPSGGIIIGNGKPNPEPLPDESQPDESQPDESQPDESQPDESQPDESQPDESQPDESQPDESQPDESQPDESQPDESQPDESQPDESAPSESKPENDTNHSGKDRTQHDSIKHKEDTILIVPAEPAETLPPDAVSLLPAAVTPSPEEQQEGESEYSPSPTDESEFETAASEPLSEENTDAAEAKTFFAATETDEVSKDQNEQVPTGQPLQRNPLPAMRSIIVLAAVVSAIMAASSLLFLIFRKKED